MESEIFLNSRAVNADIVPLDKENVRTERRVCVNNRDWEQFGQDIYQSVQDAVNTGDFSRLNQTVTNAVDGAFQTLGRGMRDMGDAVNRKMDDYNRSRQNRQTTQEQAYEYQGAQGDPYQQTARRERKYAYCGQSRSAASRADTGLYCKTTGTKVLGIVFASLGYTLVGVFLLALLIVLIAAFAVGDFSAWFQITTGTFTAMAIAGIVLAVAGTRRLKLTSRFKRYQEVLAMADREYCDVKELSAKIGKAPQFVVKDLQKMISKGWFKQGRLDAGQTCLMVSDEAYEQYENMMKQMELKKQEEARRAAEQKAKKSTPGYNPELEEVIRRGDEYVARIRKSNEAIPGEEISAKIYHMEMLVDRIFDRVEQNPSSVKDIQKLMDYYLPTTMKLLEAYEEMDAQPIQGENILNSKREIENTLDTLNVAFEKLLDGLFQDTAWDVSSDAAVLKTMLAQEGLTENDF